MMTRIARSALKYFIRNFPISKGKNRIVNALWKPLSFGDYQVIATLRHADLKMSCDLTQLLQRQLYFWGSYEDRYCEYWMKYAQQATVVFDVGANVGLYSLLAAKANPRANVHAFEPTPSIVQLLRQNIDLNGIGNVTVNAAGVGRYRGPARLRECKGDEGSNEGMNFVVSGELAIENGDASIQLETLDDYCRDNRINRIDILKMDIEGGEYDALVGANGLLSSHSIGCLFIEFVEWAATRSHHSTSELKSILLNAGYQIYRLAPRGLTPLDFDSVPNNENVLAFAPHYLSQTRFIFEHNL